MSLNKFPSASEHQLLTIDELLANESHSLSISKPVLYSPSNYRLSYTDNTFSGCLFLLISSSLSIGFLNISFAMKELGIFIGLINLLMGIFLTYFSCYCLIEVSHKILRISYYGIGEKLLNRKFGITVQMCLVMSCYIIYLRYLIILGFVLARSASILDLGIATSPDNIIFKIFFALVVFIIACFRSINILKHTSKLTLLSIVSFCTSIIYSCFAYTESSSSKFLTLGTCFPSSSNYLSFITLEILIISVNCQINILTVYEELGHGDTSKVYRVLKTSTGITVGIYTIIGLFGSVLFFNYKNSYTILIEDVQIPNSIVLIVRYI